MITHPIGRPDATEHLPYYGRYIALVPDGNILEMLVQQIEGTLQLLREISEAKASSRYAPEKWSIKEVVGHMIDTERVFSYRALVFARNDTSALPSFEQDAYIQFGNFGDCPLRELANEFECVRDSTLFLLRHLNDEAWTRRGIASDAEISVRALAYIIAGHELHHVGILKTRYLI